MREPWADFGADLHLELTGVRIRAGLEAALREAIRSGRLRGGTRLPPSRALARDLGIARNTVGEAYAQLLVEGWLASRQGSGTWVAQRSMNAPPPNGAASEAPAQLRHDLRPGVPDLTAFPRAAWLAASRRALVAAPFDVFGYTDPRGLAPLRVALSDYVGRVRGVAASPDRVVVCVGFGQALELLCTVLRARGGTTLAVEAFGHRLYWGIAERAGLRLRALPVDAAGADVDALGDSDAALLTPAHQFPLGVALSPERRRRVARWAAETGGLVIEDDYDGEFRYDRQAIGAMQALAPDHIVYTGTASKTLAPGLRLAWLVLPPSLADEVASIKASSLALSSTVDQLTLAELITSGAYDRHVRRARLVYRGRRDAMVTALARRAPQTRVSGIAAGLHALVHLAPGDTEDGVTERAREHHVSIDGLSRYSAGAQPHEPAIVVGYARPPAHAYTTAIARLCAAFPV